MTALQSCPRSNGPLIANRVRFASTARSAGCGRESLLCDWAFDAETVNGSAASRFARRFAACWGDMPCKSVLRRVAIARRRLAAEDRPFGRKPKKSLRPMVNRGPHLICRFFLINSERSTAAARARRALEKPAAYRGALAPRADLAEVERVARGL